MHLFLSFLCSTNFRASAETGYREIQFNRCLLKGISATAMPLAAAAILSTKTSPRLYDPQTQTNEHLPIAREQYEHTPLTASRISQRIRLDLVRGNDTTKKKENHYVPGD